MTNYVQAGETLPFTNITSNPVSSGDLVVVGALIGVAAGDVAAGDDGEMETEGVFTLPKASASEDIGAGDLLYEDDGEVTGTPGTDSKPLVGAAVADSGSGVATVRVKLGVHGITGPSA
jgi:predicted RecA/RadA family phage recombinase